MHYAWSMVLVKYMAVVAVLRIIVGQREQALSMLMLIIGPPWGFDKFSGPPRLKDFNQRYS